MTSFSSRDAAGGPLFYRKDTGTQLNQESNETKTKISKHGALHVFQGNSTARSSQYEVQKINKLPNLIRVLYDYQCFILTLNKQCGFTKYLCIPLNKGLELKKEREERSVGKWKPFKENKLEKQQYFQEERKRAILYKEKS